MNDPTHFTPEEALLQAYLDRPLSHKELQQVLTAVQQNSALSDDAALLGLLRELRLERRIAKHETASWKAFSQQVAQHHNTTLVANAPRRWQDMLVRLWGSLQPAMPALAVLVIAVQTGGLMWLSSSSNMGEIDAARGGSVQACPAVIARFKASASMADVSQLLIQTQATIVAGPDASGFYRLQGPAEFTQDAAALLKGLVNEIQQAPDCKAAP